MANNQEDTLAETRRRLERLFGYPPGAFDPATNFFRDMERINRSLGEGFKSFQEVMSPQDLRDRIEALHPDQAPLPIRRVLDDIMSLPRRMWEILPKPAAGDGLFRR